MDAPVPQLVSNPVQQLLGNTENFLKDHLIIAAFRNDENGYTSAGPHRFRLEFLDNIDRPGRILGTYNLHEGDCYYLRRETGVAGPNTFDAYWIPYEDDTVHAVNLGYNANLAFTARMDACAFGYTNFDNGIAVACHANAQTAQGTFDDNTAQQMISLARNKLMRQQYKTSQFTPQVANASVAATAIGMRVGRSWKFFFQKYEMNGMRYRYWGLGSF